MSKKPTGPMVFDLSGEEPEIAAAPMISDAVSEDTETIDPSSAPPVPDDMPVRAEGRAMMTATRMAAARVSWLSRLFWAALLGLVLLYLTTAAWDFAFGLMARNVWLGRIVVGLGMIVLFSLAAVGIKELAGFSRLARLDSLRNAANGLRARPDADEAVKFVGDLRGLYRGRDDLRWALADLDKQDGAVIDGKDRLDLAERLLLAPLDAAAVSEIETAARQVATITAIVPLALADVVVALTANIRMVRRIAEIYGGRSGSIGSWRLIRAVSAHLVATGAVGVADDMIGSIAGGGAVAKLSRRFGEGIVNGALTTRVGIAAMDVCRPMPFDAVARPSVTTVVKSALTGMFSRS